MLLNASSDCEFLRVKEEIAGAYWSMFVNRLAYTVQSPYPGTNGKHFYYRPTEGEEKRNPVPLNLITLIRHLEGTLTIGLYAINPETNRSKWVAIDADYSEATRDLLKLQWELKQDGVEAAFERSRRGGHLWIFAEKPLLAKDCRIYIYNLAARLKVPVKQGGLAEGIEVFPRQDAIAAGEFGNGIRAPLGVHRATKRRYWFYGADQLLEAQMAYLQRLKKITESELASFVTGLEMPEEYAPRPKIEEPIRRPSSNAHWREFRILDYVTPRKKVGKNYVARCPSCARSGRDRGGDNLSISVADPKFYICWAGCRKEMIREALGCPIRMKVS